MAKVDFYVLDRVDEHSRYMLACRLAEKAWRLDNSIHIETMSAEESRRLDDLLWTFRDGSFVPHEISAGGDDAPITIGHDTTETPQRDLLITLCDEVPAIAEGFPRVAELVTSDESSKLKGRARFSQYRDQGHEIDTHKI